MARLFSMRVSPWSECKLRAFKTPAMLHGQAGFSVGTNFRKIQPSVPSANQQLKHEIMTICNLAEKGFLMAKLGSILAGKKSSYV